MPDLGDNCSALSSRRRPAAKNSSVTKPDVAREKLGEGTKKFARERAKNFHLCHRYIIVPTALWKAGSKTISKHRKESRENSPAKPGEPARSPFRTVKRERGKKVSQKHAWNFHVISARSRAWFHVCLSLRVFSEALLSKI